MGELLKKLKQDGMNTAVAELWFKEYRENKADAREFGPLSKAAEEADRLYANLSGFLWGLCMARVITDEMCYILIDELIYAQYGKEGESDGSNGQIAKAM